MCINRLELIPYLKTCIDCSEEVQTFNNPYEISSISRILEEASIQYDREDTYQEIASANILEGDPSFLQEIILE